MKTAKYLLLSFMMILLAVNCVSCSDDDDPTENAPFVGTWMSEDGLYSITFNSSGNGAYDYFDGSNSVFFTWSYDSSDLVITTDSGNITNYQWSISGDQLQLYNLETFETTYYTQE
jgi:outer membrane protein assembly factor BamA